MDTSKVIQVCRAAARLRQKGPSQLTGILKTSGLQDADGTAVNAVMLGQDLSDDLSLEHDGNRYQLLGLLGAGAFGGVFRARTLKDDREVAIKISHEQIDDELDPQFAWERRAHESLKDVEGVLRVHDSFIALGAGVFVMELCEESLESRLSGDWSPKVSDKPTIDVGEAIGIARQLLETLAAVHAKGFIHRDLKPDNILLRPAKNEDPAQWVIADCGLAVQAPGEGLELHPAGSLEYMAPEVVAGFDLRSDTKLVDARGPSDVYSIACLLFRMIQGEPPIRVLEADGVPDLAGFYERVRKGILVPPTRIPDVVWLAIQECLDAQPQKRHSADRLLRLLPAVADEQFVSKVLKQVVAKLNEHRGVESMIRKASPKSVHKAAIDSFAHWLVQSPASERGWILHEAYFSTRTSTADRDVIRDLVPVLLPAYSEWQSLINDVRSIVLANGSPSVIVDADEPMLEIAVAAHEGRVCFFDFEPGPGVVSRAAIRLTLSGDRANPGIDIDATDCLDRVVDYLADKHGLPRRLESVRRRLERLRPDKQAPYYIVYRHSSAAESDDVHKNLEELRKNLGIIQQFPVGSEKEHEALDPFLEILAHRNTPENP